LGPNGIEGLPTNFFINTLMEIMQTENASKLICEQCEESKASWRCKQCEQYMCESCIQFHNKLKKMKSHAVTTLTEIDQDPETLHRPIYCQKHPGKECKLYCESCDCLICKDCGLVYHRDHNFVFIEESVGRIRKQIEDLTHQTGSNIPKLQSMSERLKKSEESTVLRHQTLNEEIKACFRDLYQTLQEREREILAQLNDILHNKQRVLKQRREDIEARLKHTEQCALFTNNALKHGNSGEVILMKNEIINRLRSLDAQTQEIKLPPEESYRFEHQKDQLLNAISNFGTMIIEKEKMTIKNPTQKSILEPKKALNFSGRRRTGADPKHLEEVLFECCEMLRERGYSKHQAKEFLRNKTLVELSYGNLGLDQDIVVSWINRSCDNLRIIRHFRKLGFYQEDALNNFWDETSVKRAYGQ